MSTASHAWRRSLLPPGPDVDAGGFTLVVADLHNHSLHSDGTGDPEQAFAQMRAAGLDVAALTDHSSIPRAALAGLGLHHYPDEGAVRLGRLAPRSFDDTAWTRTGELADEHDVPGEFTAIRGFEWTEPWLGHVNVWFSDEYLTVTTPGSLHGLQEWLVDRAPDALFGYNHPGREPGRLADFALPRSSTALARRMVALEAYNRAEDFLFGGYADGHRSPLVDCLDAGWRPGLIGCSDEHGRSYGLAGKGRTGLWVREHSRAGVREALLARRSFATREVGLRLDATMDGVRMGGPLPRGGTATLEVDLGGERYARARVELQLLVSGAAGRDGTGGEVAVAHRTPAVVGEVTSARVEVPDGAPWAVLRVADTTRPYGAPAPPGHPCDSWGVAYTSPWFTSSTPRPPSP